jgi:predicted ribosome quality control (RQC) complex YloA/Tae2 family protein
MKSFLQNSVEFRLGTNAEENWALLGRADKTDWWVHLADHPSAHVIIATDDPLPEDLQYAKQLILQQTKKAPTTASIVYAQVKYVKRGSKPGEVIVKPGHMLTRN